MYKIKNLIPILGYTSLCGLGLFRGVNYYKYKCSINNKPYIYSDSIIDGGLGIFLYGNPILLPIIIHKELYKLEINIRNLENEKKSSYYNELI
jgi:hypothetical protein